MQPQSIKQDIVNSIPSPDSSTPLTSKNSAPRDSICSLTAALVSKALTTAPMFFAVATAARPATPPPLVEGNISLLLIY